MDLYFSPLACSMATRIALYEAGKTANFLNVKRLPEGSDFLAINPMGLVPVLRTDGGVIITENAAILQHVAGLFPEAGLMPADPLQAARARQWLSFVGTELHKAVFAPVFDRKAPETVKAYAVARAEKPLVVLDRALGGRDVLLDAFSVADAYLFTVLNWAQATPIDLARFPAVAAYHARLGKRESIARAVAEELALYLEEQAREKAA